MHINDILRAGCRSLEYIAFKAVLLFLHARDERLMCCWSVEPSHWSCSLHLGGFGFVQSNTISTFLEKNWEQICVFV